MKRTLVLALFFGAILYGCGEGAGTATQYQRPPDDPFSFLNGYGIWFEAPGLGTVWQPTVAYEWQPYQDGQWVYTERGWIWESDEPFAWVVYHYGYWTRWGGPGWVWVPAYEWSPSRVRWYSAEEFVGWAPAPPPQVQFPQAFAPGYEQVWTIVPAQQFTQPNVGQYRATPPRPGVTRGTAQDRPPDVGTIQRLTNQEIRARQIEKEEVRQGQRTLTRVRIRDEEWPRPTSQPQPPSRQPVAPLPPAVVTPPATQRPAPTPQRGAVRPPAEKKPAGETNTPTRGGTQRETGVTQPAPTPPAQKDTARVRQSRPPAPRQKEKQREE